MAEKGKRQPRSPRIRELGGGSVLGRQAGKGRPAAEERQRLSPGAGRALSRTPSPLRAERRRADGLDLSSLPPLLDEVGRGGGYLAGGGFAVGCSNTWEVCLGMVLPHPEGETGWGPAGLPVLSSVLLTTFPSQPKGRLQMREGLARTPR